MSASLHNKVKVQLYNPQSYSTHWIRSNSGNQDKCVFPYAPEASRVCKVYSTYFQSHLNLQGTKFHITKPGSKPKPHLIISVNCALPISLPLYTATGLLYTVKANLCRNRRCQLSSSEAQSPNRKPREEKNPQNHTTSKRAVSAEVMRLA